MIGDGYQHLVTAWLFGNLAAQLGYLTRAPSFEEIRDKRVYPLLMSQTAQVWAGSRCAGRQAFLLDFRAGCWRAWMHAGRTSVFAQVSS